MLRKETKRYAILKHKNHTDKNLAQSHRNILQKIKKNSKKYSFWKEETTRLDQLLTNPEQFGETWKGFGENKTQSNDIPEDIDGKQWEDHFRKLFVKHEGNIDEVMTKKDLPITHELSQTLQAIHQKYGL